MPELPEVETVVNQLAPIIRGSVIHQLHIFDPKLKDLPHDKIQGTIIEDVTRKGKQIVMGLNGKRQKKLWLMIHLRMTGRLIWQAESNSKHLRAKFVLANGDLNFIDPRRFGVIKVCGSFAELEPIGLDPMSSGFTTQALKKLINTSQQEIKTWLLRQDRLVGFGNIYASEVLHTAKLHPQRRINSLNDKEINRLKSATQKVLKKAIKLGGTTFSDFQDSRGSIGKYVNYLRVYARAGEKCRVCSHPIEKITQQQRSTFFCPTCQRN